MEYQAHIGLHPNIRTIIAPFFWIFFLVITFNHKKKGQDDNYENKKPFLYLVPYYLIVTETPIIFSPKIILSELGSIYL